VRGQDLFVAGVALACLALGLLLLAGAAAGGR
jgi:hypothetical protein